MFTMSALLSLSTFTQCHTGYRCTAVARYIHTVSHWIPLVFSTTVESLMHAPAEMRRASRGGKQIGGRIFDKKARNDSSARIG